MLFHSFAIFFSTDFHTKNCFSTRKVKNLSILCDFLHEKEIYYLKSRKILGFFIEPVGPIRTPYPFLWAEVLSEF